MTDLPTAPGYWDIDLVTLARADAVAGFGFTERQARFLVTVLLHAGVFVERRYCAFAGITHGQKTHNFLRTLVEGRYATAVTVGPLHRGRLFHVHHKALYAAIGETDSRHRKPATLGRFIERVMVLDGVLADPTLTWLGTEADKRTYLPDPGRQQARTAPVAAAALRHRGSDNHALLPGQAPDWDRRKPNRSRVALPRHTGGPHRLPDVPLAPPRAASIAAPLDPSLARSERAGQGVSAVPPCGARGARDPTESRSRRRADLVLHERKRLHETSSQSTERRFHLDVHAYRRPRFAVLYRRWLERGDDALWLTQSDVLRMALERGEARIECVELPHQYLHLTRLVGVA